MATDAQVQRIAALVDELVETSIHYEPVYTRDHWRNKKLTHAHRVTLPGLLTQLEEEFAPGSTESYSTGSLYGSRPPVSLDCLSAHTAVTIAVARWLWDLQVPQRDTVQANLRALVGRAPRMGEDEAGRLASDLARWARWCRVLLGWSSPAFRPHNAPCPMDGCTGRGTLRVNLGARTAVCLMCQATWDEDSIVALANHVRVALGGDTVAA